MKARLGRPEAAGGTRLRRPEARAPDRSPGSRPLELQRLAGNRATAQLVQRLVASATRPTLKKGDTEQMVGVLQQKLDALGEKLAVDAEFGGATRAAVIRFQSSHPPLAKNGTADDATWAALDGLVAGGELQADGSLSPVGTHTPADPTLKPTEPGSSTKPKLEKGAKGAAVAQLHEQLNQVGASLPVAANLDAADKLEFEAGTETAVRDFQKAHKPLAVDGIVGVHTWAALDALAPGSSMGRFSQLESEKARGKDFSGVPTNYDWVVEPNRTAPGVLRVRVRYDYQDDPANPLPDRSATVKGLLGGIKGIWNTFKAVEQPTTGTARPDVLIEFDPQEGAPADKRVVLSGAVGHSNTANYFIQPGMDLASLSAHEFGHHFGLMDEYQQTAADHQRETGEAAPVGDWKGDGTAPEVVAKELHAALTTPPRAKHGEQALAVIQAHGLQQGAFAQRVAQRYLTMFGISVVADCNRLIDEDPSKEGDISKQRLCTQPFLYTAENLMGGAETQGHTHEHDVEPRHVRHLCALLGQAVGGIWEPARR